MPNGTAVDRERRQAGFLLQANVAANDRSKCLKKDPSANQWETASEGDPLGNH